jgi:hypothetical protein
MQTLRDAAMRSRISLHHYRSFSLELPQRLLHIDPLQGEEDPMQHYPTHPTEVLY